MHPRARLIAAGVCAVALSSAFAGCSSPDTAQANAQVCANMDQVQGELATLRVMLTTGVATVSQVEDQVSDVRNSVHSLTLAGEEASQAAVREIQQAQAAFEKAIDEIPSNASVTEAREAYKAALTMYADQVRATTSQLGCASPAA